MNKLAIAKELIKIAGELDNELPVDKYPAKSRQRDIKRGIGTFIPLLDALDEIIKAYKLHWSFGASNDPVLQDMVETSSELHKKAIEMRSSLHTKMDKWNGVKKSLENS